MALHDHSQPEPQPFYPGYEIGYDQITTTVTLTGTTEGSPTTVITCASHTFDGGPVLLTFFCPRFSGSSSGNSIIDLLEGATNLGRLGFFSSSLTVGATFQYRFTPSAGAHSYLIVGWGAAGNGAVIGGAAGANTETPCFVRFTKV